MTVWYKQGVCGDLSNYARKALGKVAAIYEKYDLPLFVTSIRDGNHSPGSLHYDGNAFDIKKSGYSQGRLGNDLQRTIFTEIKEVLGNNFDVISEGDHIHIEFDPKNAKIK